MPDCPPGSMLKRFLDGVLDEPETEDLCAHVEECPLCQGELDDLVGGSAPKPRPGETAEVPRPDFDRSFLERMQQILSDLAWLFHPDHIKDVLRDGLTPCMVGIK
jgi:Putative zinc-finger